MKFNRTPQSALCLVASGLLLGVTGATAHAAPVRDGVLAQTPATSSAPSFPKQDPAQCTAFGKTADVKKAKDTGKSVIGLWTGIFDMPEAQKLYNTYLTPGPVSHRYSEVRGVNVLKAFRTAPETKKALNGIVDALKAKVTTTSPAFGRDYDLNKSRLGTDVPIAWSDLETTPGFLAGGLSGVQLADHTFVPDHRKISGTYSLNKRTTKGKTKVTLDLHRLSLSVRDSIDFCPGNLGSGMIRDVSLALSRLERTPYRDTKQCTAQVKCFAARPVLFKVTVPLNDVSIDMTDALVGKARPTR
ncbi:hypothetical protein [Streptomyces muensis]|uniref:Secreted protein n=1 Tax=Streptomyces muensis TaxID=1077944 RepID=A0A9X1PX93_STRM4|nr:hypothetical protein [Streptomyces muensis]MCF1595185.1 hypothetical protein [Streptomyces muensis]